MKIRSSEASTQISPLIFAMSHNPNLVPIDLDEDEYVDVENSEDEDNEFDEL